MVGFFVCYCCVVAGFCLWVFWLVGLVLFYHDSEFYLTVMEVLQCWLHSAITNYTLESDVSATNKF